MATRQEIEDSIVTYLNRSGDATITTLTSLWFRLAHRDIQRRHNFRGMQTTDLTIEQFVDGTNEYDLPDNFKHPKILFVWDDDEDVIESFLFPTDIANIRSLRYNKEAVFPQPLDPSHYYYAIWQEKFHIYPTPDGNNGLVDKYIGGDYYQYLSLPSSGDTDWLTTNAEDLLLFQSLIQSIPYLGSQDDGRSDLYAKMTETALNRIKGEDIELQYSGPLRVRG